MRKLKPDCNLPPGWTVNWATELRPVFKNPAGRCLVGRQKALEELFNTGASQQAIHTVRSGMEQDGWERSVLLPKDWFFKQYTHRIQGQPKQNVVVVPANGKKYRSKRRLFQDFPLTEEEKINLEKLMERRKVEISGDMESKYTWSSDYSIVPHLWKYRCYTFKHGGTVEKKVHLYMTPEGQVIQGERLVHQYLRGQGLLNLLPCFSLFRTNHRPANHPGRPPARQLTGRESRESGWQPVVESRLAGWQFRLTIWQPGRIQYRAPDGTVLSSRGSVIRFMMRRGEYSYSQLLSLKKLLKTNHAQAQLERNDQYIKSLPVDRNYLIFLKLRYKNSQVEEVADSSLPKDWRKKIINGVEYIRTEKGGIFNSRKLATDYMKRTGGFSETEMLQVAMEDLESESELSESDGELSKSDGELSKSDSEESADEPAVGAIKLESISTETQPRESGEIQIRQESFDDDPGDYEEFINDIAEDEISEGPLKKRSVKVEELDSADEGLDLNSGDEYSPDIHVLGLASFAIKRPSTENGDGRSDSGHGSEAQFEPCEDPENQIDRPINQPIKEQNRSNTFPPVIVLLK